MKTSELTGAALDWAVAKCLGVNPRYDMESHGGIWLGWWIANPTYERMPRYSTDWAQGGPIIERERISISSSGYCVHPNWKPSKDGGAYHPVGMDGPTPLIAAMRCYVASKLGDEIEIPEELK